jgi:hypothetical protein
MKTAKNQTVNSKAWASKMFIGIKKRKISGIRHFLLDVASITKKSMIAMVLTLVLASQAMSQKLVLSESYSTSNYSKFPPVKFEHKRSFNSKIEAINAHLETLEFLGIDTSNTFIDEALDTPIFSNFLLYSDKKTCIITYVTLNDEGGYDSCFLESKNIEFDLFESDGLILTNSKR